MHKSSTLDIYTCSVRVCDIVREMCVCIALRTSHFTRGRSWSPTSAKLRKLEVTLRVYGRCGGLVLPRPPSVSKFAVVATAAVTSWLVSCCALCLCCFLCLCVCMSSDRSRSRVHGARAAAGVLGPAGPSTDTRRP